MLKDIINSINQFSKTIPQIIIDYDNIFGPEPKCVLKSPFELNQFASSDLTTETTFKNLYYRSLQNVSNISNQMMTNISFCIRDSQLVKYNFNKNSLELLFDTINLNYRKVQKAITTFRIIPDKKFNWSTNHIIVDDPLLAKEFQSFTVFSDHFYKKYMNTNIHQLYDIISLSIYPHYLSFVDSYLDEINNSDIFDISNLLFNLEKLFLRVMNKFITLETIPHLFKPENVISILEYLYNIKAIVDKIIQESNDWDKHITMLLSFSKTLEDILDNVYTDKSYKILKRDAIIIFQYDKVQCTTEEISKIAFGLETVPLDDTDEKKIKNNFIKE